MFYLFENFELDAEKVDLRRDGAIVALEPQVFSLLLLLVENRDRMVSKDEIIEKIWDGRNVSESAVSSRIKSARRALGDDGKSQRFIRTVHGSGFRFVVDCVRVRAAGPAPTSGSDPVGQETGATDASAEKPSIAVLPFRLVGIAGPYAMIADALPHELIVELSRLRWLFVIARGSSFRFRAIDADARRVGEALKVRYCLSGQVEIAGTAVIVIVELTDTRDGGVVWGERFTTEVGGIFEVRSQIAASIVSALEIQIPLNEARLARLKPTENLDAWSAYHLGLQHMFRFNKHDNAKATTFFERAIAADRDFPGRMPDSPSRIFRTLSCGTWKIPKRKLSRRGGSRNAASSSIRWTPSRTSQWAGSSGWSRISTEALAGSSVPPRSVRTTRRASMRGLWTDTVSGRGVEGQKNADLAMSLSPIDPLLYAMLGTRALSHLVRGDGPEAASWADRAARAPGAHVLIGMIAIVSHSLNGDDGKAAAWASNVRSRNPAITQHEFFRCFPFGDNSIRRSASKALSKHDL